MPAKKTLNQFINELNNINPQIEVLEKHYVSTHTKIHCKCLKCGFEWFPIPCDLLHGHGCPRCAGRVNRSYSDFVEHMRGVNANIDIVSAYQNVMTKVKCRCRICNHLWDAIPNNLLRGSGCPKCAGTAKLSQSEFMERIPSNVTVMSDYINSVTKIEATCDICGFRWLAIPAELMRGAGCPKCRRISQAIRQRLSEQEFLSKLHEINPNIVCLSHYTDSNTAIQCKCKDCNYEWHTYPKNLIYAKNGCPNCSHVSTSFVEQFIYHTCVVFFGAENVFSRDTQAIGLELDIYIPSVMLAIEFGSWYWHREKTDRDALKRAQCISHGIRLITIYDSYQEEDSPFKGDCYVFAFPLAIEADLISLKNVLVKILSEYGVDISIISASWTDIYSKAKESSRRISSASIRKKLQEVQAPLQFVNDIDAQGYVTCQCVVCGNEWTAHYQALLNGHYCVKCARNRVANTLRKDNKDVEAELELVNPNIEIIGDYISRHKPVKCRCKICGHVWNPRIGNLMKGVGCPKCNPSLKHRKSHDVFVRELTDVNPNIHVQGTYTAAKQPITVSCTTCGHIWNPKAYSLLEGRGCPRCANKMRGNRTNH